jgi:hypothetical protein
MDGSMIERASFFEVSHFRFTSKISGYSNKRVVEPALSPQLDFPLSEWSSSNSSDNYSRGTRATTPATSMKIV